MSDPVTTALHAPGVDWRTRPDGPRSWIIERPDRSGIAIRAGISGDWLRLRRDAGKLDAGDPVNGAGCDPWTLVTRNGHLTGGVRFVLDRGIGATDGPRLWLVGDVVLDDPGFDVLGDRSSTAAALDDLDGCTALARRCREVVGGLAGADEAYRPATDPRPTPLTDTDVIDDLREACRATGLLWTDDRDRGPVVELDTVDGPARAIVSATTSRGVRFRVDLAAGPAPAGDGRSAIGRLLLVAAARGRLARSVVRETVRPASDIGDGDGVHAAAPAGRHTIALEVCFDSRPTSGEIGHALSSLAVALGVIRSEVRLLHDPLVAQRYLDTHSRHRSRAIAAVVSGPAT